MRDKETTDLIHKTLNDDTGCEIFLFTSIFVMSRFYKIVLIFYFYLRLIMYNFDDNFDDEILYNNESIIFSDKFIICFIRVSIFSIL